MMNERFSYHVYSLIFVVNSLRKVLTKFEVQSIDSSRDRTGERM